MNETLQKIYDKFADTYEENRGLFDMTEVFNSFNDKLKTEKGILLDLGCGAGESLAKLFIDRGWKATGVDFSRRQLELAAKHVPQMTTVHADMREVEFPSNHFNAITAVYSLFHIPASEHKAMFEKMHRWLCPNGKALFTYATKEYTGSDEFEGYKEFLGQQLYYSHKSPEALYDDLKKTGFEIESADYRNIGNETFLWVTVSKPACK